MEAREKTTGNKEIASFALQQSNVLEEEERIDQYKRTKRYLMNFLKFLTELITRYSRILQVHKEK